MDAALQDGDYAERLLIGHNVICHILDLITVMSTQQEQLSLFDDIPAVESLLAKREDQWFDRKSFRITAENLADRMVGLANADGGRFAIGIHNGRV